MDIEQLHQRNRLDTAMELLGLHAIDLARASGADHSLVSKWRRGQRSLTQRSKMLQPVAQALLGLDAEGRLKELILPYQQQGESDVEATCAYLTSGELPALPPRAKPPKRQTSGEYTVQYRVLLGNRGFRRMALYMLDYVLTLPPGREIVVLYHQRINTLFDDGAFIAQFMKKLQAAFLRGARLTLIYRQAGEDFDPFSFGQWTLSHLSDSIRTLYYSGAPPDEQSLFVASIKDYWSARGQVDPEVEDQLYLTMYTDPVNFGQDEAMVERYRLLSRPITQYNFFTHPAGDADNPCLWPDAAPPRGNFSAIQWLPGMGIVTQQEFELILGRDKAPELPSFFFPQNTFFAAGPHTLVLCSEAIQEAMGKQRTLHPVFSQLLGRRAFVSREMLCTQLHRLIAAMSEREDFQLALVPRAAFQNLRVELVCWESSACLGWMQSMEQSIFTCDTATCSAFYYGSTIMWDNLLAGWKNKDKVRRQLQRWIAGKDLSKVEKPSALVRNWRGFPKAWR